MERADDTGDKSPEDKVRRGIAVGFTMAVHAAVFVTLSFVPQKPLAIPKAPISVKLVVVDANLPTEAEPELAKVTPAETQPVSSPPETQKSNIPAPLPTFKPQLETSPDEILPEPLSEPPPSNPLSILSTQDDQFGDPIPDKWRLPIGTSIPLDKIRQSGNPNFAALTRALDCLGFDADCAEHRKVVFSEDQLTGTDLVWMRSTAHSGLSDSDLYGLSEAEIRDRLGITTAGQNGFAILPGIAIDGPWWDALHGVNKACDYGISGGSQALGEADFGGSGRVLVKRCAPLRASSKDRIGFIPKPVE